MARLKTAGSNSGGPRYGFNGFFDLEAGDCGGEGSVAGDCSECGGVARSEGEAAPAARSVSEGKTGRAEEIVGRLSKVDILMRRSRVRMSC